MQRGETREYRCAEMTEGGTGGKEVRNAGIQTEAACIEARHV